MKSTSHKLIAAFACGATFLLAQTVRAQDSSASPSPCPSCAAGGGEHKHFGGPRGGGFQKLTTAERLQKLTEKLNLTADQQAQIKPILEAEDAQVKAALGDNSLSKEQKFAKVREARQAARGHIKGLLTAEQQQKIEQFKQEHGGPRHGKGQDQKQQS